MEWITLVIGIALGAGGMWLYMRPKAVQPIAYEPPPEETCTVITGPLLDISPIGNTQAHITRWEINYQDKGQEGTFIFPTIMNQMPHEERHAFHKHMAAEAARWKLGVAHEYNNLA